MTIFVEQDTATNYWRLLIRDRGFTAPAGPRLFRAPPHPEIEFRHDTQAAANEAAAKLRVYLDGLTAKKKKKSTAKSAYEE